MIDAEEIANHLLKSSKAVCVNIFENVKSFYLEDKKIRSQMESVLFIKTFKKKNEIERFIKEIHKYDTPIIVEIKTGDPNTDYLNWFLNE
jgi:periplasmic divalent cation tolerance protein